MKRTNMRLLMGVGANKIFHVKEFAVALSKFGVECKVVIADSEVYDGFPNRRVSSWFQTANKSNALFNEFEPDAVFVDTAGHFAKAVLDYKLPLLSHLRGDYWSEMQWYKETLCKGPIKRTGRYIKGKMEEKCFRESTVILPICNHLKEIVKKRYPNKPTTTMYQGIESARWDKNKTSVIEGNNLDLKHPCVGLLQSANIWGKTREMLVLPKVLEALPDMTFYWAGDGPYRDEVLPTLSKYDNFVWLGNLDYPDATKKYLSEIDVYALISGIDMLPSSLQEAQLMEKPILATNVGGIPETMQDKITGFLVEQQNPEEIVTRIREMIHDEKKSKEMGKNGRQFVQENFNWNKIATDFVKIMKMEID